MYEDVYTLEVDIGGTDQQHQNDKLNAITTDVLKQKQEKCGQR